MRGVRGHLSLGRGLQRDTERLGHFGAALAGKERDFIIAAADASDAEELVTAETEYPNGANPVIHVHLDHTKALSADGHKDRAGIYFGIEGPWVEAPLREVSSGSVNGRLNKMRFKSLESWEIEVGFGSTLRILRCDRHNDRCGFIACFNCRARECDESESSSEVRDG